MGKVRSAVDCVTDSLDVGYRPGELVLVTATRAAGWSSPGLYLDTVDDVDFAEKPRLRVEGDRLQVTVPVTDGWGEKAPDLRNKSLTLVLAGAALSPGGSTGLTLALRQRKRRFSMRRYLFSRSCNDGADPAD